MHPTFHYSDEHYSLWFWARTHANLLPFSLTIAWIRDTKVLCLSISRNGSTWGIAL